MKCINAPVGLNFYASLDLKDRRFLGCASSAIKRSERRKSRRVQNAELVHQSVAELRKDFVKTALVVPAMPPLQYSLPTRFLLSERPAPTRFKEVTVVRKRASQRKATVETLLVAA